MLGDIEKELYSLKNKFKERGRNKKGPEIEEEENVVEEKSVWFKRLLLAAFAFVFISVAGAIYFILQINSGSRDISLEISSVREVPRGIVFDLDINIGNRTDSSLLGAELALNLPAGLVSLNALGNSDVIMEPVGDIGVGGLSKKSYKILATGESDSVQKIAVELSYLNNGSRFKVESDEEISIKKSAIEVEVKKPEQILSGSTFGLEVKYKNVSDFDFSELILEAKYPAAFKFISSSLSPESLNNRWRLGEFKGGSDGSIQIKGALEGFEGVAFSVPFTIYGNFLGKDYPIVESVANLTMAPSPINLEISLNRQTDYVARVGDKLTYSIQYKNNSGIALADVAIKANLVGELFDFATLETNALVDSGTQTFVWNTSNVSNLRLLDPGATGEAVLSINLKPQFPIQRLNDKNFSIRFNVEITSPSVPYYLSASKTKALASLETKVAGLVLVDAKAFYRDASSGILNAGTLPPKVNQPTDYTVHWLIKNYSTDVKTVEVRAFLQPNVEWAGIVKSNLDSVPLYNEMTREVVWALDKISATKGVLSDPIEAVFQIKATPQSSHIGQYQPLLS